MNGTGLQQNGEGVQQNGHATGQYNLLTACCSSGCLQVTFDCTVLILYTQARDTRQSEIAHPACRIMMSRAVINTTNTTIWPPTHTLGSTASFKADQFLIILSMWYAVVCDPY